MPSGIFKSLHCSVRSLPDFHECSWKTSFNKKEIQFFFPPATKRGTVITPASKSKEISGKLALFQTKLILTCNTTNYMQNTTENVFFSILFHNASLFTFPHIQTLTSLPGASVQSLYLPICVSFRNKSMRKLNDLYSK